MTFNILYKGRKIYQNLTHEECVEVLDNLAQEYYENEEYDVNEIELNGPDEDEFEHNHETSDKKLVGNKTKGSTDDPSGSSSSDQKKGKKGRKNNQNDDDDHHNDKNLM